MSATSGFETLRCRYHQPRDHLRSRDGLDRVAQHRVFKGFPELAALHDVRPLGHADLVIEQLAQCLQGQVLLLQCRHPFEKLIAENVEAGLVESRDREQVDHVIRIDGAADHLTDRGVDVPLPRAIRAAAAVIRQKLANHRPPPAPSVSRARGSTRR